MRMDTLVSVIVVVIIIGAFGFLGAMRRKQTKNWEQGNLTGLPGQGRSLKDELGEFKHPAKKSRDFLRRVK